MKYLRSTLWQGDCQATRYHNGTFYMVTANVSQGGHFYMTARDPAGE